MILQTTLLNACSVLFFDGGVRLRGVLLRELKQTNDLFEIHSAAPSDLRCEAGIW